MFIGKHMSLYPYMYACTCTCRLQSNCSWTYVWNVEARLVQVYVGICGTVICKVVATSDFTHGIYIYYIHPYMCKDVYTCVLFMYVYIICICVYACIHMYIWKFQKSRNSGLIYVCKSLSYICICAYIYRLKLYLLSNM